MQPLVQHVYVLRLSLGDRCKDYVTVIVSPVWNGLLEYLYMLSSLVSPGTVGKGSPKNGIPSDCSPILSTPKRSAHSTVLATPSTRSRMYYSGFNSPAAIRWLCSPAMCPATRVGNRKRTSNPALSEQVTHNPEDEKERQVLTWVCGVCMCTCLQKNIILYRCTLFCTLYEGFTHMVTELVLSYYAIQLCI